MAATQEEIQSVAQAVEDICKKAKQLEVLVQQVASTNSTLAIDWPNVTLEGKSYDGQQVANAIGAAQNYSDVHWNTQRTNYEHLLGETPIV